MTERIIVTVVRASDVDKYDIEIPIDMPAYRLIQAIAQSLNWPIDPILPYQIIVLPQNRALRPNETLADLQIWDGSWLYFQVGDAGSPIPTQEKHQPGWRKLELPEHLSLGASETSQPASGYHWKRVDQD